MTVSLALRENGRLQAATAERIRATAKRLGYMPNPKLSQVMAETARTRHGVQSGTLAFLTTEPVDDPLLGGVRSPLTGEGGSDNAAYRVEDEKSFHAAVERAGTYGYRMERFCITEPSLSAAGSTACCGAAASRV